MISFGSESNTSPVHKRITVLAIFSLIASFAPMFSASALTEVVGCREFGDMYQTLDYLSLPFDYGHCIGVSGNTAYVAGDTNPSIIVVDISDPTNLIEAGSVAAGGVVTGLAGGPGILVATIEGVGFVRYDLTDPFAPVPVDTLNFGSDHLDVVLNGDLAYVALGSSGVQVVSMQFPGLTVPMGHTNLSGHTTALAVDGDVLYAATFPVGLSVVDVSNPTQISEIGQAPFDGYPLAVNLGFDRVVVAGAISEDHHGQAQLRIYDPADPVSPTILASGTVNRPVHLGVDAVLVEPDRVLLSTVAEGTTEYIVSDGGLQEWGHTFNPGAEIFMQSGTILMISFNHLSIAAAGPLPPGHYSSITTSSNSNHAVVDGSLIVTSTVHGLLVIDVSDPTAPTKSDQVPVPAGTPQTGPVAIVADHVFLTRTGGGMSVFDLSFPMEPQLAGEFAEPVDTIWGMAADGTTIFAATGHDGLAVLDASDPLAPVQIGNLPPTMSVAYRFAKMVKAGSEVLVSAVGGGIDVFDVSNPTSPVLVDHLAITGEITDMDLAGGRLLVGRAHDVMVVWQRESLGWEQLGSSVQEIDTIGVFGNNVYTASGLENHINIMKMPASGMPEMVGELPGAYADRGIVATEQWVGAIPSRVDIFPAQCSPAPAATEIQLARSIMLAPPSPNPFNPRTVIRFTLPMQGQIELELFDLAGRRVRTLWRGVANAGENQVTWDGTNDNAQPVAAGVYLVRLRFGEQVEVQKLALVK